MLVLAMEFSRSARQTSAQGDGLNTNASGPRYDAGIAREQ
jgi:hypothetical protein